MYKDNQTVIEFMGKAQKKIAELTSFVVDKECDCEEYKLLTELYEYLENLDQEGLGWTLEDILDDIDYWNRRAELNTIPFLYVVGYDVHIIGGGGTGGNSVHWTDVIDFSLAVNNLIKATKHNSLSEIQGGNEFERYHLTRQEYEDLLKLLYPFVPPTVSLRIVSTTPTPTNGVYEKGTTVSVVTLASSHVLNGGKSLLESRYYKGGDLFVTYTGTSVNNQATYNQPITQNTVFKYEGDFEVGGMKSSTVNINFELPYYTAVDKRSKLFTQLQTKKVLRSKPTQLDVAYTLNTGNAMASDPSVLYLAIPKSWGLFKVILVDNNPLFDYITEWKYSEFNRTLPDGSIEPYYLYEYKEATEGTFNFNFKWQ